MIAINKTPLFKPGRIVATPACLKEVERAGQNLFEFLARHFAGDWGELDAEDDNGDREATTGILPSEY